MPMDVTIILLLPAMLLSLYAQYKVKSTFSRYSTVRNSRNLTGRDVAERILHGAGIFDVRIEHIRGSLTDHYSPKEKVLRLSDDVYNSTSIAAIGVAAHECGHAIQHDTGYSPLTLRNSIVPIVNIGSQAAMPLFMLGLILGFSEGLSIGTLLVQIGILLFTGVVFFQFLTLPVEFNASKRATDILLASGYLDSKEISPAKKVLRAAALTYIAAAAVALANLIRLILISKSRKRDR